jgi:hypothetical protein
MSIRARFLAVTAALLFAAAPALAQVASAPPAYSDDELKTFAVAIVKVQRLNHVYLPKLDAANTPEEQEKVLQSASDAMTRVVEDNGMSVNRFTQILDDLLADAGLAERVRQHIRESP